MQYLPDNLVSLLRSEVTIASVPQCVAELVHNSVDARASHVDIFLRLSPLYILVKDDGHGIMPDDMHHIGRRHFTSKCRELRDLESIRTFGFRGEALAGIAAISQLTVTSRHSDYRSTNTVTLMNSKIIYNKSSTTSLASHGTHVVVQNLFNNLPVRRRSILGDSENNKSSRDDIVKSVKNCLVDVALSLESEAVNIRFRSDSGLVLNLSLRPEDKNDACTILKAAYGRAIFKAFDTFNARHGDVTIAGLVALDLTSTKNYQYIFINRRKLVASAIYKSLSDLFSKYRYVPSVGNQHPNDLSMACASNMHPIFVVHVIAPLSGYDLCQDPGKVLVDVENFGDIETAILDSMRNFLSRLRKLPDRYARRLDTDVKNICPNWESPVFDSSERSIPRLSSEYQPGELHLLSRKLTKSALQQARFISQINKEFILLSIVEGVGESTLVMVDQHAADERVRLEMLLVDYFAQVLRIRINEKWLHSLSRPGDNDDAEFSVKLKCDFSVSQEDFEALAEWQVQLELWGVRYNLGTSTDRPSKRGMTTKDADEYELTVHVTHCPVILIDRYMENPAVVKQFLLQHVYDLQSGDVTKLVASQISDIINNGCIESAEVLLDLAYRHIPRVIVDLLNSKACRGAIMFGDSLSEDRSRKLIDDLSNCRFPFQCAHGRPSMVPLVGL
ncbi:hypothetical protein V1505DRAFT_303074 [Lipomyces doorenjongii]